MTPLRGSLVAGSRRLLCAAVPLGLLGVLSATLALSPGAAGAGAFAARTSGRTASAPNATPQVSFEDLGPVGGKFQAVAASRPGRALVGIDGRIGVVDTSRPEAPVLLHRSAALTDTVSDIAILDGRAWIAAGWAGLFSMDINTDTPEPGPPLDVPAGVSRLAADPPFLLAATREGAVLLRADDPSFQVLLGVGPITDVALARYTAFVLQGDQILVFDITKPALPKEARPIRLEAGGTALAATRSLLFASDGESSLRVYSLDNPRNPRRRGSLDSKHVVADLLPVGAYVYLATESSGVRAVHVLAEPVEMGGRQGQNGNSLSLASDGFALYSAGGTGVEVYDIQISSFPRSMGVIPTMSDMVEVMLRDGVLYAAGSGGVNLADIEPPHEARVLSRVTMGFPDAIAPLGTDYILVGDGSLLYVIDVTDPSMPARVAVMPVGIGGMEPRTEYVADIQVSGTKAFLANGRFGGLSVVDVASPTLPVPIMSVTSTGFATKLALVGPEAPGAPDGSPPTLAILGDSQEGLIAYDIRDPALPVKLGATGGTWFPYAVAMWGEVAVVVAGDDGMLFYDVQSDPASPDFGQMRRLGSWWPGMAARSVSILDGIAFVGGDTGSACRVVAIDLAEPADPREAGCWGALGAVDALDAVGDLMAVSAYGEGVRLVKLTRAAVPATPSATPPLPLDPTATATTGRPSGAVYLPALTTGSGGVPGR